MVFSYFKKTYLMIQMQYKFFFEYQFCLNTKYYIEKKNYQNFEI